MRQHTISFGKRVPSRNPKGIGLDTINSRATMSVVAGVVGICAVAVASGSEIGLRAGYWTGRAVYRIGGHVRQPERRGYVPFPISELDFPIAVAAGEAALAFEVQQARIELRAGGSLTEEAGSMKDSDWLTPSRPEQVDVYSESRSDLDGFWGAGQIRMPVLKTVTWGVDFGGGLRYETLEYACRLIRQWSPSGRFPEAEIEGDGTVGLTYRLHLTMPYVDVGMSLWPDARARGMLRAEVAWVQARDKDVHLLRDPPITAKGTYDGAAVRLRAEGEYVLASQWTALVTVEAMGLYAQGDQRNTKNGRWTHTIEAELEVQELLLWTGMVWKL